MSDSRQDHNHCLVDCEGLILVDVVSRGKNKLRSLRQDADKNQEAFQRRSVYKNPTDILLQRDNSRPNTRLGKP